MSDQILAISMFFSGGVGSICMLYLHRIASVLDEQARLVRDMDKRLVSCEVKVASR